VKSTIEERDLPGSQLWRRRCCGRLGRRGRERCHRFSGCADDRDGCIGWERSRWNNRGSGSRLGGWGGQVEADCDAFFSVVVLSVHEIEPKGECGYGGTSVQIPGMDEPGCGNELFPCASTVQSSGSLPLPYSSRQPVKAAIPDVDHTRNGKWRFGDGVSIPRVLELEHGRGSDELHSRSGAKKGLRGRSFDSSQARPSPERSH
jgi:hypothetical protein